jgi:hypothetical protein
LKATRASSSAWRSALTAGRWCRAARTTRFGFGMSRRTVSSAGLYVSPRPTSTTSTAWCSARMDGPSLPVAVTTRSGCGTCAHAALSGRRSPATRTA